MGESQDKYFCPRLIDYIAIVGSRIPTTKNNISAYEADISEVTKRSPLSRGSTLVVGTNSNVVSHVQTSELLKRYPLEDHNDFPLPKDIVCFCQPEGCITTTGKLADYNKASSFVFTISDKDTVRTRYGVCVNFYRPIKRKIRPPSYAPGSIVCSTSDSSPERTVENNVPDHNPTNGPLFRSFRKSRRAQYNTLTSLCLVSHHQFFKNFRECLFYLKNLADKFNESLDKVPGFHKRRISIWDLLIKQNLESTPVCQYVKDIEKWILRLLSAPVPVPGKTRVELELLKESQPPLVFSLPDHTRFSLLDFPLHLPFELLGIETCLRVLTLILLEKKVVFQSRDYNALPMSVMAFIALVYPLEYMFPVIPLLPVSLDHAECLLDNPTPYVVGVPVNFFAIKGISALPDDVWLVDLDANKIFSSDKAPQVPQFPQPEGTVLKNALRRAINMLSTPIPPSSRRESTRSSIGSTGDKKDANTLVTWTLEHHRGSLGSTQNYCIQREVQDDSATPLYGCDVDAIDVAVRTAVVQFFNSGNMLANLTEHTRTIRLFPRPVVSVQSKSFIQSRNEVTSFIEMFARTQAVEYFAEYSLTPTNVVFQRIHTGVTDPTLIGDKSKWFAHTLEPVIFSAWSSSALLETILQDKALEELDQSDVDTDFDTSGTDSSDSDTDISSDEEVESLLHFEGGASEVYNPPSDLQVPFDTESPQPSSSASGSTESDMNSLEFQPSSLVTSDVYASNPHLDSAEGGGVPQENSSGKTEQGSSGFSLSRILVSDGKNFSQFLKNNKQDGLLAKVDKITIHAKKAAGEASKSMQEVSKTALEASRTAAGMSKSTFEDLTHMGRNKLGDLTKSAKEVASKSRFLKMGLLSESVEDYAIDQKIHHHFDNVMRRGSKVLVEQSPLIRHSSPKRSPERYKSLDRSSAENHEFLKDLAHQVLEGESIGWLKISRCRKLLEDESNRCLLLSKLNRTLDNRVNPSDYIDDVCVSKQMWKSMLKILQAAIHGLENSFLKSTSGGMASAFHVLEIAHTHYWCKNGDTSTVTAESQVSSPFSSREDLQSSASELSSQQSTITSGTIKSYHRSSIKSETTSIPFSEISATADALRDLFSRKKTSLIGNPSIETECLTDNLRMSPESGTISETGSMITNPSYVMQRMHKSNLSFRSAVSDSEIEHTPSKGSKNHSSTIWSSKSSLSTGLNYNDAGSGVSTLGFSNADTERTYLYEGIVGKDRSSLWDDMQFWDDAFIDSVSHEREIIGIDQGPEELMDKYRRLNEDEQKRLAHDEDRLLSTMLYNLVAFMVMMNVRKEDINSKVRGMLGKCRIAISYAEEITNLLSQLHTLEKNDVDLKCVASRLGHGQSFAVHAGTDSSGMLLFVEVRDDGLVMRTMNGTVYERWWYERVINMTYSPKNKVLCLWKKVGGQTSLHKYYTKKSKQLYYCIKTAMERAVSHGHQLGQTVELGGEFPVKDIATGEGGLLQVCMEGVGLLFCGTKFFIKLKRIRKCYTVKGRYFILEEYNPKTRLSRERKYESSLAPQICYSLLCVFSYTAAVREKCKIPQSSPDRSQESATLP